MAGVALGRRADRTAVIGSLAVVSAIAWALTMRFAAGMPMPAGATEMASAMPRAAVPLPLVSAMWAAMMVGMMVPTATPMVLAFSDWTRRGPSVGSRLGGLSAFLSGYVLVWLGFSVLAAIVQSTLTRVGLLGETGAARPAVGGALLVLAGLFQATPWKESCLHRCRTPTGFLIAEWRDGARGAVVMGVRHGVYCLGCCWLLMAVLLVVGTMHLVWMAVLALFVLAEKVAPRALGVRYVAAVVLCGWGVLTLRAA